MRELVNTIIRDETTDMNRRIDYYQVESDGIEKMPDKSRSYETEDSDPRQASTDEDYTDDVLTITTAPRLVHASGQLLRRPERR